MDAFDLRIRTKKNIKTSVPSQEYRLIKQSIEYAVSQGEFSIWEEDVSEIVKDMLKKEHFKVKWNFFGGGYTISW